MVEEEVSHAIVGAAIEVHRELGPGLLEKIYERFLIEELLQVGLKVERQRVIPVRYKGREVDCGYRLDLLVEGRVIVELKAVERLMPIHEAQAMTYLKLTGKRLCLLLNFNVCRLNQGGIRRIVLGY